MESGKKEITKGWPVVGVSNAFSNMSFREDELHLVTALEPRFSTARSRHFQQQSEKEKHEMKTTAKIDVIKTVTKIGSWLITKEIDVGITPTKKLSGLRN